MSSVSDPSRPRASARAAAKPAKGERPRTGLNREISFRRRTPETGPRVKSRDDIVLGAEPYVSLLPPEVIAQAKARVQHKVIVYAVLAVIVLMFLATGGTRLFGTLALAELSVAQSENDSIVLQQKLYSKVRTVQADLALVEAAERAAVATEINWRDYYAELDRRRPPGVRFTSYSGTIGGDQQTNVSAAASAPPLARISVIANGPTENSLADLLDRFATLPGYVSTIPSALAEGDGGWTTTVTITVDEGALSDRAKAARAEEAQK